MGAIALLWLIAAGACAGARTGRADGTADGSSGAGGSVADAG